ncbi:MAG: tungsten ABC transporter substrate-binding protein, partial [Syntrophomonadaceae bacterium]|nr:tungsten ABC transporter substrate-binding protein [Syntrophomonadaceae bacterium]
MNRIKRLFYILLVLVLSLSLLSGCEKEKEVVKET